MHVYIVGPDPTGSPVVESVEEVDAGGSSRLATWRAGEPVPGPRGRAPLVDLGVEPGDVQWNVGSLPPHCETAVHRSDTVDLDAVLSGEVTLELGEPPAEQSIRLGPGDCVVLKGVDHSWRTGEQGCVIQYTLIGLEAESAG